MVVAIVLIDRAHVGAGGIEACRAGNHATGEHCTVVVRAVDFHELSRDAAAVGLAMHDGAPRLAECCDEYPACVVDVFGAHAHTVAAATITGGHPGIAFAHHDLEVHCRANGGIKPFRSEVVRPTVRVHH